MGCGVVKRYLKLAVCCYAVLTVLLFLIQAVVYLYQNNSGDLIVFHPPVQLMMVVLALAFAFHEKELEK